MKVTVIYQYYWPDRAPYGQILRPILRHLSERGHEVSVLTAQPSYNDVGLTRQPWRETNEGVHIRRLRLLPQRKRLLPLRILNTALFLAQASAAVMRGDRPDLILANVNPPILMGLTLRLLHRLTGIDYVLHCQDIHPEALRGVGVISDGWLYRLLERIDTKSLLDAKTVITLSEDMVDTLVRRGVPRDRIVLSYNPPVIEFEQDVVEPPSPLNENDGRFDVLFGGNHGRFQALDVIVEGANLLASESGIRFVFMGDGLAKPEMERIAGTNENIVFLPYQPQESSWAAMTAADLGIVSLSPGFIQYSFPSKFATYLSTGCRIVAYVEPTSQLAQIVDNEGLGVITEEMSAQAFADAVRSAYETRHDWTEANRQNNRQTVDRFFSADRMRSDWDELMAALEQ